jgi:D-glycero-D-manno-heptose 1,7-bisphosphate phosphatase
MIIIKKAVFLDRDGTLIEDRGYMKATDQIVFLPGVIQALQKLMDMKYELIVVSNQSGIGRGLISEKDVLCINNILSEILQSSGIRISTFYFCPHHPNDNCDCRKPRPGMILRALNERDIDKSQSYMVGDKLSDAAAGIAAGVTPVLISNNIRVAKNGMVLIFDSLLEFVSSIDGIDMN